MAYHDRVLHAKLTPPRPNKRALPRPALVQKLKGVLDHRLTIVQAPVGFGKSTALMGLVEAITMAPTHAQVAWYTITEEDSEPERYLSYLIAAFHRSLPNLSDRPLAELEALEHSNGPKAWHNVIDALINAITQSSNAPIVLIEEDYHLIARNRLIAQLHERLVSYMPPNMHTLVSLRYPLDDPSLTAWRARGEVLDFGPSDLSFSLDEIKTLFGNLLGKPLSEADAQLLAEKTEGFPIAVQMIGQAVLSSTANNGDGGYSRSIGEILASSETPSSSLKALFDVLTRDLLNQLRPTLRDFLRDTCVLRVLSPAACDALTGKHGTSAAILNRLSERALFTTEIGKSSNREMRQRRSPQRLYRYHALFQEYLCSQLDPAQALKMHARAAEFYRTNNDLEAALYHTKMAGNVDKAAEDIEQLGEAVLHAGRLDTLAAWIHELPPTLLLKHPRLQLYLGDISRMKNRFSEALAWYSHAEAVWRSRGDRAGIGQALRAKAMIHLDTMQPALGQALLEQALALAEGIADQLMQARTLELLAENKLNLGQPDEAQKLLAQAQTLKTDKSSEDALSVRVKIRTGHLQEAKTILEAWAEAEQREAITDRSHRSYRETQLLLAFMHVLLGNLEQALRCANDGVALGERLRSPFISAMAQVRLGDIWQVKWLESLAATTSANQGDTSQWQQDAIRAYRNAIAIGKQLGVYRVQATAMRGLTRAIGMGGDLDMARAVAKEGVELGNKAGDGWISAHVEFSLGASLAHVGHADAVSVLNHALVGFRDFSDQFCIAATRLWLALAYFEAGQAEHAIAAISETLSLSQTHSYGFLFTKASLLGLPDVRRVLPLLMKMQQNAQHTRYVGELLAQLGLPKLEFHPGYQLRISTLGGFRVWRGAHEIQSTEWQRDKARQLFQLFIVHRGRRIQREEITETLWEGSKPDAAWRDFRVALNALFKAIEPNRESEAPSAYIGRDNTTYFLRPEADIWLDCAQFEQACQMGDFAAALKLYRGDFLPDAAYETWAIRERERLANLHLRAAEKLAQFKLDEKQPDETIALCERILQHDACWENAYRLAMVAYAQQGNRAQAMRMYERCVNTLRNELGVPPSKEIENLKLKMQN